MKTGPDNHYFWLGMQLERAPGELRVRSALWADESAVDYGDPTRLNQMPWESGEPNGDGKCVTYFGTVHAPDGRGGRRRERMQAGSWNDLDCQLRYSGFFDAYLGKFGHIRLCA